MVTPATTAAIHSSTPSNPTRALSNVHRSLLKNIYRRTVSISRNRTAAYKLKSRIAKILIRHGDAYCIDYLKRSGQGLIWNLTGANKPKWVSMKTNRGPRQIPDVFAEFCNSSDEVLLRLAKLARSIRLSSVTKQQSEKVLRAVTAEFSGSDYAVHEMCRFVRMALSRTYLDKWEEPIRSLPAVTRQFRRVVSVSGKTKVTHEPPLSHSLMLARSIPSIRNHPRILEAFNGIKPEYIQSLLSCELPETKVAGEIHVTQEGGGKLRMFAAPYTIVQSLLTPLHEFLAQKRRFLVTDCTYNQLSGASAAQQWLKEGMTVHSVDLSTATCRFPLLPQLAVLDYFEIPNHYRDLFLFAARAEWEVDPKLVNDHGWPNKLTWKVGQPLGIVPSMSLFSLTHNLLLRGICIQLGLPWNCFRVLGDDVVINNELVANTYTQLVAACGIDISRDKSYVSGCYAEFAGASITKNSILRPGQWRPIAFHNLLDYSLEFGWLSNSELAGFSSKVLKSLKIALFSRGEYEPSSLEEYSEFLKINSQLVLPWDWCDIPIALHFHKGLAKVMTKQGLDPRAVVSVEPPVLINKALLMLRPHIPPEVMRQFSRNLFMYSDNLDLAISQSYLTLCHGLENFSSLSLDKIVEKLSEYKSVCLSAYWLPPRSTSRRRKDKVLLSKVLALL